MSFLFEGDEEESTSTSDPWATMPEWMKEAYKSDAEFRGRLLDDAEAAATKLGKSPREILGPSFYEEMGLDAGTDGFDAARRLSNKAVGAAGDVAGDLRRGTSYVGQSDRLGERAQAGLGGINSSIGRTQDAIERAAKYGNKAAGLAGDTKASDKALGLAGNTQASRDALEAAGFDVDALRAKYETGYTDDVVNTTLSGMTRAADRERAQREEAAAAVGGTSNTRRAVADAVAQQLTGESMAKTEAELRDRGFSRAMEGAFGEAGLELERAGFLDTAGLDRASVLDQLARTGLDRAGVFDQLQRTGLASAETQRGVTADQLEKGEFIRGLAGDKLDRASAARDTAGLGIDLSALYDSLGTSASARGLQEAGLLGGYGEMERGIRQARKDERRTADQQSLGWLADIFAGTQYTKGPVGTTDTQTQEGNSLFENLLGAGATIAGAYIQSDERVKEDVAPISDPLSAVLEMGGPQSYRYKEGHGHVEGRTSGLMAQGLEHIPGAVVEDGSGVLKVDPWPVLATVVGAVQQLAREKDEAA